ncbi:MAG TPA: DinB family protein [Candidatus Binatia bacterium]|nr:DinB family protein [Candidatus Binatia bacterium]
MSARDTEAPELAAFDLARDGFVAGLAAVPDGALGYLERGGDYTLGGLVAHVNAVLERYLGLLDAMAGTGFRDMTAPDDAARFAASNSQAARVPSRAELDADLAEMERLHGDVHARFDRLAPDDLRRTPAIRYGEGSEPYPTSPLDVLGWLTGHYEEHITHVTQLLDAWRSAS